MVKEFMELRRIQTDLGEVLDKIELGVVNGIQRPVDVETVVAKLEAPKSCDECPVERFCVSQNHNGVYCKMIWEEIISYCTKIIVHEA